MENMHIKFPALNVHFDGLTLDFLGSRKPAYEGMKRAVGPTPLKVVFTVVSQFFVKTVADHHVHAAYHNKL